MFSIDQVGLVWDDFQKATMEDRLRYQAVYDTIETYIAQYSEGIDVQLLLIGGSMGINLLLEKDRSLEDFTYELYTEDSFWHANNITNAISAITKQLVVLRSLIPFRRYQIMVDTRPLILVQDLGRTQNVSITSLIRPIKVKTFDKKNQVLVLSPEMQLIDLYRTLYSPNRAEDWEISIHDENQLFKHLLKRSSTSLNKKGGEQIQPKMEERQRIQLALLKFYIQNNRDTILVGEHGLRLLMEQSALGVIPLLQVISTRDSGEDFEDITKIIQAAAPNQPITRVERPLHIMQDFRITRTVIRVGDASAKEQKEVLYLYNSATYDLIPINRLFSKGGHFIQIGNPFVILRFLLVDLWMVNWIEAIGGINEAFSKHRRETIMEKILALRQLMNSDARNLTTIGKRATPNGRLQVFQPLNDDYVGNYIDEVLSQKAKMKDLPRRYHDYYPQDYYNKNGEYRQLEHEIAKK